VREGEDDVKKKNILTKKQQLMVMTFVVEFASLA
jgi:hypothetical protein